MPKVVRITDEGGNVVATREYDAFGNVLSETGDWSRYRWGFHPNWIELKDSGGRLYLTPGGRIYDTETGRFLQRDPEARPADNAYLGLKNSPLTHVDPDGGAVAPSRGKDPKEPPGEQPAGEKPEENRVGKDAGATKKDIEAKPKLYVVPRRHKNVEERWRHFTMTMGVKPEDIEFEITLGTVVVERKSVPTGRLTVAGEIELTRLIKGRNVPLEARTALITSLLKKYELTENRLVADIEATVKMNVYCTTEAGDRKEITKGAEVLSVKEQYQWDPQGNLVKGKRSIDLLTE